MLFNPRHLLAIASAVFFGSNALAQSGLHAPILISRTINNNQRVTLAGNTRSAANAANDLGPVADSLPMEHMLLQLQRSAEQEQALEQFLQELQDPTSPNFHKWLTPSQFGQQFGLAQQDLDNITQWLQLEGFTVNTVYPNGTLIDFTGTAGTVRSAFKTQIHNLNVNGVSHVANVSDPQIPEALAPAIKGIVSLNDFRPHQMNKVKPNYTFTSEGVTYQAVVPADLATIYNFNPLFASKITGAGQTVVVIEDANLYSANDWNTFRSTFGLTSYKGGTLVQVNPASPSGRNNCANPGTGNGDDIEATLDAEWASAAAPSATIEVAACASTNTTFGGLIAMQNLLNTLGSNVPSIMSISYGECEAENGAAANATYNNTYAQAASEGVSVFVSAGDEGAASCDAGGTAATHGIGVSAFASTPNNVAVGGTDFEDTYLGATSTYWSSTNSSTYESAKSYIPEIPWNDSCASVLLANYLGYGTTYGTSGFCNSSTGIADYLVIAGGSGGPSGCATGVPSTAGVVSGTCAGYAKPAWQTITGNPSDHVRDIPDVSMFAANGVWGHYYVVCFSDPRNGGAPCKGAPSSWVGAGGTSFSSPIVAGLQALVNQVHGKQGNVAQVYYQLAANSSTYCKSNSGGSGCVFYDVTAGDMDMACSGTNSCFDSSTTTSAPGSGRSTHGFFGDQRSGGHQTTIYGVLSTSDTSYVPAYGAGVGWDFATGIGSINAANLVNVWP